MSSASFQNRKKRTGSSRSNALCPKKKGYKALIMHVFKTIQVARFVEFVTHKCPKLARATASRSLAQGLPSPELNTFVLSYHMTFLKFLTQSSL
jgi:hypothetical protein